MCNLHGYRKCPACPCDESTQTAAVAAVVAAEVVAVARTWNRKERELIMIIGIRPGSFSTRLKTT